VSILGGEGVGVRTSLKKDKGDYITKRGRKREVRLRMPSKIRKRKMKEDGKLIRKRTKKENESTRLEEGKIRDAGGGFRSVIEKGIKKRKRHSLRSIRATAREKGRSHLNH